ncbi:MAG: BrnA antitoxin family protein [Candidatus Hydrogenedentes bacterium]|nr:BrnA antitoxin family protein [Candidatus Hydrogenedentota bacterium]
MSMISLRLPESLHRHIRQLAKKENVSINQLITLAVAEKLSALETGDMIAARTARGSKTKFRKALSKAPRQEPGPEDRI